MQSGKFLSHHALRVAVLFTVFLVNLGLGVSPSYAQQSAVDAPSTTNLGEVVVTASRNPELLSATSAHTTVITRQDIENSQVTDLVTLLQREAGLQLKQTGGVGTTSTLFMRGLPALDTLVLIDGVPQNRQDATGSVGLEHVMLDNVERVEIVRGNVSAIYGSGAIGGVIQIFTRGGKQSPTLRWGLELGPRDTAKTTLEGSVTLDQTSLRAGVSRLTTQGFSAKNPQQDATANPDTDGYQNSSAHAALTQRLSDQHSLGIKVTQSEGNSQYDGFSATGVNWSVTRQNQTTLFSDNHFGAWHSNLSYSDQSEDAQDYSDGPYGAVASVQTAVQVWRWVNTLAWDAHWLATAGTEHQTQHAQTASTSVYATPYDHDRTTQAVFAGVQAKFDALNLQLNVRHDEVGDLHKNTAYLGAGYALSDTLKISASTSTAFNAPPIGYLYYPDGGNPLLRPELAHSHEIALQYAKGEDVLRATYFDTRIEDQLSYSYPEGFVNINRTHNTGVELSWRASVPNMFGNVAKNATANAADNASVRASLTLQNPVNEATDQTLSLRSKTMASFGVQQPLGAWLLGADLRYVGPRNDDYAQQYLSAYTVLDMTLSYRYSPQTLFTARLDNAGDAQYQTSYGYNQTPRSFYLGLVWTPKM